MGFRLWPGLKPGDAAPDFDLLDQDGRSHRATDYRGRWLVLFFYPKDNTPGCVREACRFGDDHQLFKDLGAEIVGISGDAQASHLSFRQTCRLRYDLLSDPERSVRDAWKVPHILRALEGRTTYVVDPQGIVRFVYDQRLKAEQHPVLALEFLRQHAAQKENS